MILILTALDQVDLPDKRSSALRGRLRQKPAPCLTWKALNLLLLAHSLPTSFCFSLCSLVYSACVSKQAVPSGWHASSGSRYSGGSSCLCDNVDLYL